jgi:ABC-2 type transport system ATP-binding protein
VLEIENLSKSFGDIQAVNKLSLKLESDSVVGFLGPNGAGKTTTMRMVSGYLVPDSGSVRIYGHDIVQQRQAAQSHLGYLPEAPNGFGRLTVREFLVFCGQARRLSGQALEDAIDQACDRVDLSPALYRPLAQLSKGWRQRAWLAQAILHEPRVLVLDEPTDGLDPNQKELVRRLVRKMKVGRTIVLSTHILEEAEELCDRVVVINHGRLIADASLADLVDGAGRLGASFRQLTTHGANPLPAPGYQLPIND